MPISPRRVIAVAVSFAWRVVKTICPVKAASIAVWAVSLSRVSPTKIISGSCLINDLKALEKSKPFSLITWTWWIPSNVYSTGSSTVLIFTSGVFLSFNIE